MTIFRNLFGAVLPALTLACGLCAQAKNDHDGAKCADGKLTPSSAPSTFTPANTSLMGLTDGTAAWGDFDNDGKLDLLVSGIDSDGNPHCEVWRNLGNGAFSSINAGLPGVFYGSVAWGDFDNDGNLDILLTGITTDGTSIAQVWQNQGNGTFANINAGLPGVHYGSAVWGDFDNDGKLDILLTGHLGTDSTAISQVWRNQGNGTFVNINAGLPGMYHSSVAVADFDNDGKLDILLAGYDPDVGFISQIWRNRGNGVFANINAGLPGIEYGGVAVADFDNDGDPDILLSGLSSDGVTPLTQVWRNRGNGNFTKVNAGLPVMQGCVAVADFDDDGNLDILLSGTSSDGVTPITQVWRNSGNGTFANINADLPGVSGGSVAWANYNHAGEPGFFLMGQGPSGIISQLFQNNIRYKDKRPTEPGDLDAKVIGNSVVLSWKPAHDHENHSSGLSYNVRVGTYPGGSDILAPNADSDTGRQRLAQTGNAQGRLFTTLTGLAPRKTYYWSVQAIDGAYVGSRFAHDVRFTMPR